jgi:CubicO group peptidase (beta-lactamase class C family)
LIKKNKVIGASIAIVDKGQIVYATGYGFSDILEDKKADLTIFLSTP